jgi:hypothetical protein
MSRLTAFASTWNPPGEKACQIDETTLRLIGTWVAVKQVFGQERRSSEARNTWITHDQNSGNGSSLVD